MRNCIHFDSVIITIVRQPPLSKDAVQNMWLPFYLMNLSCRHPSRPLPRGDAAVEWACITTPVLQPLTLTAPTLRQPWVLIVTSGTLSVYLISPHHCANCTTLTVSCRISQQSYEEVHILVAYNFSDGNTAFLEVQMSFLVSPVGRREPSPL